MAVDKTRDQIWLIGCVGVLIALGGGGLAALQWPGVKPGIGGLVETGNGPAAFAGCALLVAGFLIASVAVIAHGVRLGMAASQSAQALRDAQETLPAQS